MAVKVIGLDTAKHMFPKQVFQAHDADASGRAALRKHLRRSQVSDFFSNISQLSPKIVALTQPRQRKRAEK
jgi:hypothetical protein